MAGIGDSMGLDNEDNLLAMEEELINAGNNGAGDAQDKIEITFSIVFDEDDDNTLQLDLVHLFEAPDNKIYSV